MLSSLTFLSLGLSILLIVLVLFYQEMNGTLYFSEFFYKLKTKTIEYPLNYSNDRKLSIVFNLLASLAKNYLIVINIVVNILFLYITSIVAYNDPETNFHLGILIFWFIVIMVTLIKMCGILWFGFVLWFSSSRYLELKFNEVFEKIQLITKNPKNSLNGYRILKAIEEHNFVHKLTEDLNHFFRMITLIIYLTGAPSFLVCLNLATHKDTSIVTSIYALIIFFGGFIPVAGMNLLSSRIDRAAKKPCAVFY